MRVTRSIERSTGPAPDRVGEALGRDLYFLAVGVLGVLGVWIRPLS
jgi:hypothetical protein